MLHTPRSTRGMVTSPHHLASQAGLDVLKEGGTALDAVIATAAALAVVYPHMTSIGGDAFWLIQWPDGRVDTIDACGAAAGRADLAFYRNAGHATIPWRGGAAANTVAGTVSGWGEAHRLSGAYHRQQQTQALPLERLLRDAIWYAEQGVPVTAGGAEVAAQKSAELCAVSGYAAVFEPDGRPLQTGDILKNPHWGKPCANWLLRVWPVFIPGLWRRALLRIWRERVALSLLRIWPLMRRAFVHRCLSG